jgi:fucose 4-O-acetylase-like acetyltransferase
MLFMFVSGYASYRTQVEWGLLGKRVKQLLLPYYLWSLVMCAIRGDFQLWEMTIHPEKSFWFLWVLFIITLFHVIACRLVLRWRLKEQYH